MKDTSSAIYMPRSTRMGETPIHIHARKLLEGQFTEEVEAWKEGRDLSNFGARTHLVTQHLGYLRDKCEWIGEHYVSWTPDVLRHEEDPAVYDKEGNYIEDWETVEDVREQLRRRDAELHGPSDLTSSMPSSRERYEADWALKRRVG